MFWAGYGAVHFVAGVVTIAIILARMHDYRQTGRQKDRHTGMSFRRHYFLRGSWEFVPAGMETRG